MSTLTSRKPSDGEAATRAALTARIATAWRKSVEGISEAGRPGPRHASIFIKSDFAIAAHGGEVTGDARSVHGAGLLEAGANSPGTGTDIWPWHAKALRWRWGPLRSGGLSVAASGPPPVLRPREAA
jgi:hypothetical protein